MFTYDLVISAVSYDAMLVAELTDRLAPRLRQAAIWSGGVHAASFEPASALRETTSRLVLLLYQRLWGREDATRRDDAILQERAARDPGSIAVIVLDDTPLPEWLNAVQRCDLRTVGVDGVTTFVLDAMVGVGAPLRRAAKRDLATTLTASWPGPPPPFLAQLRALSALRRQLDALSAELRLRLDVERARGDGRTFELHALPHRVIARLDDVGVSFSWVPGRIGTVADGRLLVIEWRGVEAKEPGVSALRSAKPVREHTYHAEATDPEPGNWRWRVDDPNGRACSTAHLVADWLTGAAMGSTRSTQQRASHEA